MEELASRTSLQTALKQPKGNAFCPRRAPRVTRRPQNGWQRRPVTMQGAAMVKALLSPLGCSAKIRQTQRQCNVGFEIRRAWRWLGLLRGPPYPDALAGIKEGSLLSLTTLPLMCAARPPPESEKPEYGYNIFPYVPSLNMFMRPFHIFIHFTNIFLP